MLFLDVYWLLSCNLRKKVLDKPPNGVEYSRILHHLLPWALSIQTQISQTPVVDLETRGVLAHLGGHHDALEFFLAEGNVLLLRADVECWHLNSFSRLYYYSRCFQNSLPWELVLVLRFLIEILQMWCPEISLRILPWIWVYLLGLVIILQGNSQLPSLKIRIISSSIIYCILHRFKFSIVRQKIYRPWKTCAIWWTIQSHLFYLAWLDKLKSCSVSVRFLLSF